MNIELITYCIIIFIVTFFSITIFIKFSKKLGLIDIPNERSSHKKPTPRGAGIVIGFIFLLSILFFETDLTLELLYPIIAFLFIYICGIVDDIKGLNSKIKFLFIILATLILIYDGYTINYIGEYFGFSFHLGFLTIPFTIFAVAGFTNGLNLTDGLDGLAGGISSIILLTLLILGILHNDKLLIIMPSFMLSTLTAFLLFNWHPAKVFMGDSGSLFLGFLIAFLSIQALNYITPTSILFLAAIPILDTMIVSKRRIQRKKSPFSADKNHMHHVLYNVKRNIKFTVNTLILMQAAFCLIFLQVLNSKNILNLILFFILFLIFFNLFDPRARRRHRKSKKKNLNKEEQTYLNINKRENSIEEPS